jgi:hypothetical protein
MRAEDGGPSSMIRKIIRYIVPFVCLAVLSCRHAQPSTHTATGDDLQRIEVRNGDAYDLNRRTIPHADETGKGFLDIQSMVLLKQLADIQKASKDETETRAKLDWYSVNYRDLANSYYGNFFSYRQKKYFLIIVGVWALLGIAGALLSAYCPGFFLGKFLLRLIPAAHPFSFMRDKLVSAKSNGVA